MLPRVIDSSALTSSSPIENSSTIISTRSSSPVPSMISYDDQLQIFNQGSLQNEPRDDILHHDPHDLLYSFPLSEIATPELQHASMVRSFPQSFEILPQNLKNVDASDQFVREDSLASLPSISDTEPPKLYPVRARTLLSREDNVPSIPFFSNVPSPKVHQVKPINPLVRQDFSAARFFSRQNSSREHIDNDSVLSEDTSGPCPKMVHSFQTRIRDMGNENDQSSMSRLLRDALPVRGVKMSQIRDKLHQWYKEWQAANGDVSAETEKDFAFLLIKSFWYEDKLAAILFMQEVLIADKKLSYQDLPRIDAIFRGDFIKVYKVCDHFATKILCHLSEQVTNEHHCRDLLLDTLFQWTYTNDLWQARAALFTLWNQGKHVILQERMMSSVRHMLARPEEEAKNMAGSALRAISEVAPHNVIEFLSRKENMAHMSPTALDKATTRLTRRQKDDFKILRRELAAGHV